MIQRNIMTDRFSLSELLMLVHPRCTGEKLFRLSLYELIARDVIKVFNKEKVIDHHSNTLAKYTYISMSNASNYPIKSSENLIIESLSNQKELQDRFLIYQFYKKADGYKKYKKNFYIEPMLQNGLFSSKVKVSNVYDAFVCQINKLIDRGRKIYKSLPKFDCKQAYSTLLSICPILLLDEDVSDKDIYDQYRLIRKLNIQKEEDQSLKEEINEFIKDWAKITDPIVFKESDFKELFSINPMFYKKEMIEKLDAPAKATASPMGKGTIINNSSKISDSTGYYIILNFIVVSLVAILIVIAISYFL